MRKVSSMVISAVLIFVIGCGNNEAVRRERATTLQAEAMEDMKNKDYDSAEMKFKKSIEIYPSDQSCKNNLAVLYAQFRNEPAKAQAIWEDLLKESPHNSAFMNNLAGVYKVQNKLDKAIELYQEAKKYAKDSYHLPYYNIGKIYIEQSKFAEAVAELQNGIKLVQRDSMMITTLAKAMILAGRSEEARQYLIKMHQENNKSLSEPIFLCRLDQKLGRMDDVKEIIDEMASQYPNDTLVLTEKVEFAFIQNKSRDEISELEKQVMAQPDASLQNWYPQYVEGRILMQEGKFEDAISVLSKLDKTIPYDWIYLDAVRSDVLSQAYQRTNDTEKARVMQDSAGKLAPEFFAGSKSLESVPSA
jgi:tetratricopeptide (TPR) repeat protein